MRRKSISILLALAMLVSSISIPAFAERSITELNSTNTLRTEALNSENSSDVDTDMFKENDNDIVLFSDITDLSQQLENGTVTIPADGSYIISNIDSTANNIVVPKGINAELTLDNVSIITASTALYAPIKVESGATLTLHLSGENTITSGAKSYAGIAVYANHATSDFSTLIIDGEGSLNVTGNQHAPAIGSNKLSADGSTGISGKIIINGGTVNAVGGSGGAGIGASYNGVECCDIEINDGIVTAKGGAQAAGIGGSGRCSNGNISIKGGSVQASSGTLSMTYGIGPGSSSGAGGNVIITGGSVNAVSNPQPVDDSGNELRQIVLKMPDAVSMANQKVTVNSWNAWTDDKGQLYPYVTDDTAFLALKAGDKSYYVSNITTEQSEYTLEEDNAECICTEINSSAALTVPDTITVNKNAGHESIKLTTEFIKAENCPRLIHLITASYELTMDGEAVDKSIAYINDNSILIVTYAAAGKTLHLSANATMDGNQYTAEKDIQIIGDNTSKFDLSKGDIVISADADDSTMMNVSVASSNYTIPKTTVVYINQSAAETGNTITVRGVDASIALSDVNIHTNIAQRNPLTIGDNVNLTIDLIGNNTLYAQNTSTIKAIASTSTIVIEGDGSLNSTSGVGAGIANFKRLTVNSGTVTARGGSGGAGIGGNIDGAGHEVIINGGCVYAYGDGNAAGIGGGASQSVGSGGSFIINGGMVTAQSGGNGSGIGYGGRVGFPGTIEVNGGSVNALLGIRPENSTGKQYRIELGIEDISDHTDVTYSVGDDNSNPIATSTDENGKLYLHLNSGKQWIRVYKDGKTYYRYINLEANDDNTGICVENPAAQIKTFEIAGQVGETIIDNENLTVTVTVPYNIILDEIVPDVTFEGAEALTDLLDFSNENNTAVYSIVGNDKEQKEYTVTLLLTQEPSVPQADVYDISKGNIVIMEDRVQYGDISYRKNDLGYIITGETTEHTLQLEYSSQKLPPIIFQDLNITSASPVTIPFEALSSADITVNGVCSIQSMSLNAVNLVNFYNLPDGIALNITGDGKLNIQGASSAVNLGSSSRMSITGVTTSISGGAGSNALSGSGEFVTDSETYMYIAETNSPEVQPKNSEGTALYQLTAYISAYNKTETTCQYNNKTYYVGNNATLYLMLPDNSYIMSVLYDNQEYIGTVQVSGAPASVTLKAETLDITYDNSMLTYKGGTVDFEVGGDIFSDGVSIKLKPDDSTLSVLEEAVRDVDGKKIASVTIPENMSTETPVVYTVYFVSGGIEKELKNKIVVQKNNSQCSIQSFRLEGQIGETSINEDLKTISLNMPYDHEFEAYKNYTATEITITGASVSPAVGERKQFTRDYTEAYMRGIYTVRAKDNETRAEYTVKIYKEPVPIVRALSFTNPSSSNGGTVRVTVSGTALSSIQNAENTANRNVYVYSEDGINTVTAEYNPENNTYTADISVPANTSDTEDAKYALKVKIGNTEQTQITSNTEVRVPRRKRGSAVMSDFTIEGQVGATNITDGSVILTMPYDTDMTSLLPIVMLEDIQASYSPIGEQDFTSDKTYTVTAENGTTKNYTVHIDKQAAPVASSIEFVNPTSSGTSRVQVKINGQNLQNAYNAINVSPYIQVYGELTGGDGSMEINPSTAVRNNDGDYVAVITVPQNLDDEPKTYTLYVEIGDVVQTLTGNVILTVPKHQSETNDITDVFIADNQSDIIFGEDNTISLSVPYNTDLRSVTPVITHNGESYSPEGAQNFNESVKYTVRAGNGDIKEYTINVTRDGKAQADSVIMSRPSNYKDTKITIDIRGQFIPYLDDNISNDTVTVSVVPREGGDDISGDVQYDSSVYGGHAECIVNLPENDSSVEKLYDVKVYVNGIEQSVSPDSVITVPRRKTRAITAFELNEQTAAAKITDTDIYIRVREDADMTALTPIVSIDGDDYSPKGAQNFDNISRSVKYTVYADGDEPREYMVHVSREGESPLVKVDFTSPNNFKGGDVTIRLEGFFYGDVKVSVIPVGGGEEISGEITALDNVGATAVISIPENNDTENEKKYQLQFVIDGNTVIYDGQTEIIVPRRTKRQITQFTMEGVQEGDTKIEGTDIYVDIPYYIDITSVTPQITYDADSITPEGAQDFSNIKNPVKYILSSSGDDSVTYTVHVNIIGERPSLKSMTVEGQAEDTVYGKDNAVKITLPSNADITSVEPIIEFTGSDYSPKGAQNFTDSATKPVEYIFVDKYGIETKYYVTVVKQIIISSGGSYRRKTTPKPTITPVPTVEPTVTPAVTDVPEPTVKPKKTMPYMKGYEENGVWRFKPDNTITRAEVATILSSLDREFDENKEYLNIFPDVSVGAWYKNYINFAVSKKYISGYEDGTCRPENMITRAEFVAIVARYINVSLTDGEDRFNDIAEVYWCRQQINALADMDIVSGYDNGEFLPENIITRAEAAAIINRALGRKMTSEIFREVTCPFSDMTDGHWAYNDVLLAACEY